MAKDYFRSTVNVFKRLANASKLMMKKSLMERTRKQKFQSLGELTYSLYKTNVIKSDELKQKVQDIDTINKEIRKASGDLGNFTPQKNKKTSPKKK